MGALVKPEDSVNRGSVLVWFCENPPNAAFYAGHRGVGDPGPVLLSRVNTR